MNEHERRLLDVVEFSSFIATFADPTKRILGIESYTYSIDALAVNVTSAAPFNANLIMDSDSDFVCVFFSGASRTAVGAVSARNILWPPTLLVQITDDSSAKTYFNMPTPMPLIAGGMGFPFLLTSPRIARPRTTLNVAFSCPVVGPTHNDVFFSMHGAKVYYA